MASDDFPAEDFRATANAFSQLAGVLGGFCFTILVLVLSPDFLKASAEVKDWAVGLLLFAAIAYVLSSSLLANSTNALLLKAVDARRRVFAIGIALSNLAHLLLASTLTIVVYQFSMQVGLIAAVVIMLTVLANGIMSLGAEFRLLRAKG